MEQHCFTRLFFKDKVPGVLRRAQVTPSQEAFARVSARVDNERPIERVVVTDVVAHLLGCILPLCGALLFVAIASGALSGGNMHVNTETRGGRY